MKRILIFSLAYFPKHVGGAEIAIKEITDRIAPEDVTFHMVCLRFDSRLPKEEKVGNVLVHRIGFAKEEPSMADLKKYPLVLNKYFFQFLAAWKASRLHARYDYDGIWAMMAHSCGIPAALFKLAHPHVKYILTLQEGDPPEHVERLAKPLWPLFRYAFTSADQIQAISNFLACWARRMGYKGDPVVVPNAVDSVHFSQQYSEEDIEEMKHILGKKEGETWLVTTSRLVYKNAIDDVICALKYLPETIHFLIFGIGPDEEKLKKLAQEEGVYERVHFYGQIEHKDMPLYLKACDIFVRPSRSEGMGNSFVEAMAAELPVIATQEGGIADFLFDRVLDPEKETTGWAVKQNSPREIAGAVIEIMRDPGETARVVASAKSLVLGKYDWDLIAREMRTQVFGKAFSL